MTLLNFVTGQSNAAAQGTALALGTYHTVALLCRPDSPAPEYCMYAMGRGFHGQLGLECFDNQEEPQRVRAAAGACAAAACQGAARCLAPRRRLPHPSPPAHPSRPLQVGAVDRDARVKLYQGTPDDIHLAVVSAGSSHSASISRRGELYTWGLASSGELGHGGWTPIEVSVPRMITSLQRTRIVSVACGANHTLAISESGQLWSCGRGRHGQVRAPGGRWRGPGGWPGAGGGG